MVVRGIDTDNYDGPVSVQRFQQLRVNYQVEFNIVGCQVGNDGANYTKIQTENATAAGLVVPAHYEFLYWNNGDIARMQRAATFGLPVFIDCEAARPQGWTISQTVDRIHAAKSTLVSEGLYGGIYTGAWWWPSNTGNCTDFKDDPLWHAAYPFGGGNLPPQDYLPNVNNSVGYGGWGAPRVFQYADVAYGESGFDMNAAEPWWQQSEVNDLANINADGSQRIEPDPTNPNFLIIYNENVPVLKIGSTDGTAPGRIGKNFGNNWLWIRALDDNNQWVVDPNTGKHLLYLSDVEGD